MAMVLRHLSTQACALSAKLKSILRASTQEFPIGFLGGHRFNFSQTSEILRLAPPARNDEREE